MKFINDQAEGGSGVARSIIDELHSSDIEADQIEGERSVTRRIIDGLFLLGYPRRSKRR